MDHSPIWTFFLVQGTRMSGRLYKCPFGPSYFQPVDLSILKAYSQYYQILRDAKSDDVYPEYALWRANGSPTR